MLTLERAGSDATGKLFFIGRGTAFWSDSRGTTGLITAAKLKSLTEDKLILDAAGGDRTFQVTRATRFCRSGQLVTRTAFQTGEDVAVSSARKKPDEETLALDVRDGLIHVSQDREEGVIDFSCPVSAKSPKSTPKSRPDTQPAKK